MSRWLDATPIAAPAFVVAAGLGAVDFVRATADTLARINRVRFLDQGQQDVDSFPLLDFFTKKEIMARMFKLFGRRLIPLV